MIETTSMESSSNVFELLIISVFFGVSAAVIVGGIVVNQKSRTTALRAISWAAIASGLLMALIGSLGLAGLLDDPSWRPILFLPIRDP